MKDKEDKPVKPVKKQEAPIDENPLAKPEKTAKDVGGKKIQKSKTMKDKPWKI